jgi:hypothetical protein
MHEYLNKPTDVPFNRIFLDPNNPRTAPEDRPGYEDPDGIFAASVQEPLEERLAECREIDDLERDIIAQGWLPIDPILVWEHPDSPASFVVIEGNTRTLVLRRIRHKLQQEKQLLEKMEKKKGYAKGDIEDQRKKVKQMQQIVDDTDNLHAYTIKAANADELEEKLPHLHAVRHISHSQPWSPYGLNLYILSQYRKLFEEAHGEKAGLALEDNLIRNLSEKLSTKPTKARQNIQAAAAFSHFKKNFEHRLPKGERFTDEDQYFFEQILQNEYPRTKFGFGKVDLHLSAEMEEVLFAWAFAAPRPEGKDNPNKLYKAENMRLWQQMRKYDIKKGTTFAEQLDVDDPGNTPPMAKIEAEYVQHKAQISPLVTVSSLLNALKELKADALMSQASHLEPMLRELSKQSQVFLKMIEAGIKVS